MKMLFTAVFLFAAHLLIADSDALSVRVISWNVLSNKWMGSKYDMQAVETLLGPISTTNGSVTDADIVAVSVQENCFHCNSANRLKLAGIFLNALNRIASNQYEFIGMEMTRISRFCEWFTCPYIHHGTTAAIVMAKKGILRAIGTHRVNKCDGLLVHNAEKGIAGVEVEVRSNGDRICFAGLHLDAKESVLRRQCLERFWMTRPKSTWSRCKAIIFAGDFNTRPGPNKEMSKSPISWKKLGFDFFRSSKSQDEMIGESPFGGVVFLDYMKKVTGRVFTEQAFNFLPTYSIRPGGECDNVMPCYRGNRQPSWTDRIVCSGCTKFEFYNSFLFAKSDHDPVVGVFEV